MVLCLSLEVLDEHQHRAAALPGTRKWRGKDLPGLDADTPPLLRVDAVLTA